MRYTNCPAVEDYNDFSEALEDIWQKDGMLLTYAAVLEAERPDTLRGACELLRNLDNYPHIAFIKEDCLCLQCWSAATGGST